MASPSRVPALLSAVLAMMTTIADVSAQPRFTPGVTDRTVTFGVSGCFSHPTWGANCKNFQAGISAAIEQLNARGGVRGRALAIESLDDAYDPKKTAENVRTFAQSNRVLGIVGLMGGGLAAAAIPVLDEYRIPAVGGTTGTDEARKFSPYLFHVRASYRSEIAKIIDQLGVVQQTKIAVVYPANAFGKSVFAMALGAMDAKGIKPALVTEIDGARFDAVRLATQVAEAKPQVVIALLSADQMAEYLKEMSKVSVRPVTYTLSVMSHKTLAAKAGSLAEGVIITQVMPPFWSVASPLANSYREAMAKYAAGFEPSFLSWEGYISARVVAEALARAGAAPDRGSFMRALHAPTGIDINGYQVSYKETVHEGSAFVYLTMLKASGDLVR